MGDFFTKPNSIDDSQPGPSRALWHDCPVAEMLIDPDKGYYFWDDFLTLPASASKYTATQATAGTFALDDAAGGVALADCNSGTATQGITVQQGGATGECWLPAADKDIWFEARVKAVDIATGPEFFLGLSVIDTTLIATSANSSANHIGFESVTDDNVILGYGEKAGTRTTGVTTHTFVNNTWVKLGFKVQGVTKITFFVNGAAMPTTLATAYIPVTEMVLSLVCQSGGTTDPIIHIDWWRCAQLR